MTFLDILRIASIVAWGSAFLACLPSIARVATGKPTASHSDVLWTLIGAFAIMVLGFNGRALIAASSVIGYAGLYVFSVILAVATIVIALRHREPNDG